MERPEFFETSRRSTHARTNRFGGIYASQPPLLYNILDRRRSMHLSAGAIAVGVVWAKCAVVFSSLCSVYNTYCRSAPNYDNSVIYCCIIIQDRYTTWLGDNGMITKYPNLS